MEDYILARRLRSRKRNPLLRSGVILRQNTYRPEPKKTNPIEQQDINKPEVQADKDTKLRHEPILRKAGSVLPKKGSVMPDIKILPKRAPVIPISKKTRQRRGKIRSLLKNMDDGEVQEITDKELIEYADSEQGKEIYHGELEKLKAEFRKDKKVELPEKEAVKLVLQKLRQNKGVISALRAGRVKARTEKGSHITKGVSNDKAIEIIDFEEAKADKESLIKIIEENKILKDKIKGDIDKLNEEQLKGVVHTVKSEILSETNKTAGDLKQKAIKLQDEYQSKMVQLPPKDRKQIEDNRKIIEPLLQDEHGAKFNVTQNPLNVNNVIKDVILNSADIEMYTKLIKDVDLLMKQRIAQEALEIEEEDEPPELIEGLEGVKFTPSKHRGTAPLPPLSSPEQVGNLQDKKKKEESRSKQLKDIEAIEKTQKRTQEQLEVFRELGAKLNKELEKIENLQVKKKEKTKSKTPLLSSSRRQSVVGDAVQLISELTNPEIVKTFTKEMKKRHGIDTVKALSSLAPESSEFFSDSEDEFESGLRHNLLAKSGVKLGSPRQMLHRATKNKLETTEALLSKARKEILRMREASITKPKAEPKAEPKTEPEAEPEETETETEAEEETESESESEAKEESEEEKARRTHHYANLSSLQSKLDKFNKKQLRDLLKPFKKHYFKSGDIYHKYVKNKFGKSTSNLPIEKLKQIIKEIDKEYRKNQANKLAPPPEIKFMITPEEHEHLRFLLNKANSENRKVGVQKGAWLIIKNDGQLIKGTQKTLKSYFAQKKNIHLKPKIKEAIEGGEMKKVGKNAEGDTIIYMDKEFFQKWMIKNDKTKSKKTKLSDKEKDEMSEILQRLKALEETPEAFSMF